MLQWAVFYKILEVPDSVEEPTAYQLLGIESGRPYTSQEVDHSLQKIKTRLRHRLPSPQFIPLLAAFEIELEKAAQLVATSSARKAYDRQLKHNARRSAKEGRAKEKRKELVAATRKAINVALNADGTLDDERRLLLAEELAEIGLGDQVVESLLERIPVPIKSQQQAITLFCDAARATLTQSSLSAEDETFLIKLGEKFHLSARQAQMLIDRLLKEEGVKRDGNPVSTKEQGIAPQVPRLKNKLSRKRLAASVLQDLSVQRDPIAMAVERQPKAHPLFRVGLPILSVIIFAGSVYFYAELNAPKVTPSGETVFRSMPQVSELDPDPSQSPNLQPDAVAPVISQREKMIAPIIAEKYNKIADEAAAKSLVRQLDASSQIGSYAASLRYPQFSPRREPLIIDASSVSGLDNQKSEFLAGSEVQMELGAIAQEIIRRMHHSSVSAEVLLGDIVVAAVACAKQTARLANSPLGQFIDLDKLLNKRDRLRLLKEYVYIVPMPKSLSPDRKERLPLSSNDRDEFRKNLASEDPAIVYHAIDTLGDRARVGDAGSCELLVEAAKERSATATDDTDFLPLWRIVRQLQQIDDPQVAGYLADLITTSHQPAFAHRLCYLLREAIDPELVVSSPGLPPLKNTPSERYKAFQFWREVVQRDDFEWTPLSMMTSKEESPAWEPDWNAIRLLAILEYHLALLVGHIRDDEQIPEPLSDLDGSDRSTPVVDLTERQRQLMKHLKEQARAERLELQRSSQMRIPPIVPVHVLPKLQRTLHDLVWELNRLVLEQSDGLQYVADLDDVLFRRSIRKVDAKTRLQKVAIDLDTASIMLELVALASASKSMVAPIVQLLRHERDMGYLQTPNVIVEIRRSMLHQLVLWELIVPTLEQ